MVRQNPKKARELKAPKVVRVKSLRGPKSNIPSGSKMKIGV